eukprot:scaffold3867_cov180-Amphora_coffeaeformis.AAC.3
MLFTLGVIQDWNSASIDFRSAFTQGQLPEPIYLELPPGYQKANPHLSNSVMKIARNLYVEQPAVNLWYNKTRNSLVDESGFKVSDFDPCLFICKDCLLCLYVDDAILHACEDNPLDEVLNTIAQCGYAFDHDEASTPISVSKLTTILMVQ